jgi:hypothetical protein
VPGAKLSLIVIRVWGGQWMYYQGLRLERQNFARQGSYRDEQKTPGMVAVLDVEPEVIRIDFLGAAQADIRRAAKAIDLTSQAQRRISFLSQL